MKDRIREIMESQHMTQKVFASFIGLSEGSLSGIYSGRTRPTLNVVELIKEKIPAISTDWLMFGKGKMYTSENDSSDGAYQDVHQPLPANDSPTSPSGGLFNPLENVGVTQTLKNPVKTEVKFIDKPQRQITEIKIFFDDQTFESFVPKK
ncbi:MAG: helix-turn-helix transcriptional regulator [Prevotella sp.]|nr:helix-turn-helix transcriptional regulator [Prevotella sp.]